MSFILVGVECILFLHSHPLNKTCGGEKLHYQEFQEKKQKKTYNKIQKHKKTIITIDSFLLFIEALRPSARVEDGHGSVPSIEAVEREKRARRNPF